MSRRPADRSLLWDDFKHGFTVDSPSAKWYTFAAGPFAASDGIAATSPDGLSVVSPGTNPQTGQPAFTKTVAQEDQNGGLPGGLDHVKFLVFANNTASSGVPGFDAAPGQVLSFKTRLNGASAGNAQHPFGAAAVTDPDDDLRLAAYTFNCIDNENFMVFDTFLTNKRVYAFYERLPTGRGSLGNYAAFSYAIPIGARSGWEHIRLAYDKSAGTVTWHLNGRCVFQVTRIGHRIDRRFMLLDHGGTEQRVSPRQLNPGYGLFTLLDGQSNGTGLARLSNAASFYFDPRYGQPTPETFLDDHSTAASRLWGQGAALQAQRLIVTSRPDDHDEAEIPAS